MPAKIGVVETFGITEPVGGFVSESSREATVEIATVRDKGGVTRIAKPKRLVTEEVTIKGKGDPNLAGVTAGAFAEGVMKVVSAKSSEVNDDFPDFEIKGTRFSNRA
ncbi:hypothetical protein [Verrucomicrobium sp. BvORR106]|uniref:hypothetical protein n=1 Tax=Verrucomicrobium sp. BvORR106 TaxID=1403819 RepID=UPI00056DBA3D|nr:hypothetical protein [Verrucomicrobium sp. BvORR106]